ncbi:hypothetical protein ANAEL_01502 [Anaerolineales bacterium]|nr:hypothetical protein ANAEL_01502 [Anaerolineales bacterium]
MTDHFVVRVIADYQAPYPDPIQAKAGDEVVIDSEKKTGIRGWVWCANSAGKGGWVPAKYIEVNGNRGRMLCDYNAIELTIHAGEKLTVHKEESKFYWVTNRTGQQGWVPVENVEQVT